MARSAHKTVRFTQIVERSGQPEPHTLWLPPDKDPELKRAVAAHRVMTIASGAGKTDQGVVGFDAHHARDAQFLIFPKSLKRFEGARVVGIKFDLIEQPKLGPATVPTRANPSRGRKRRPKPPAAVTAAASKRKPPEPVEEEPAEDAGIVPFEPPAEDQFGTDEPRKTAKTESRGDAKLVREVRAALKELKAGKSVAAYQRLERALGSHRGG